ncbi:hypothetical protein [Kitasatospora sp. McL0602]|uniref:hypothetical protein n=1 Tax=Kitasatospora sp. McL0602 TaxID=3439530 RepID=UPI003F8CC633
MTFEDEFASALRDAADVRPIHRADELAVGAALRGRRKRLRRNAVAGAVAVVVVAGGAGAIAALPGTRSATDLATPATPSPSPSLTATPSATATTPAAPVGDAEVLSLFKSLLPAGWQLSNPQSHGTEPGPKELMGSTFAGFTVDDGQGKGSVMLTLRREPTPVDMNADWAGCPDPTYEPNTVCTHTTQPDGSGLTVLQRYLHPDKSGGLKQWYAMLRHPDGTLVELNEWNSPDQADYQLTRQEPPLTPAQLTAVVTDRRWAPVLAAIAVPGGTGGGVHQPKMAFTAPALDRILVTAATLLPEGLKRADTGGDDTFGAAHFTVDDGHGKSLIEVTVQDWSDFRPGQSPGADISTEFTDADTLPDGTKVLSYSESDFGGHKGIVRNGVDILRPDKLRVLVHSFNAESPAGQPTRKDPALTLSQLKALATSPSWRGPAK